MNENKSITRYISVILVVIVLLVLSSVSLRKIGDGNKDEFKKEYTSSITSNNLYKYLTEYELLEFLRKDTGVIYFGYPENISCKRIVSILNEAAFRNGFDKIYYYNIKEDISIYKINDSKRIQTVQKGTSIYSEILRKFSSFTTKYILKDEKGKLYDTGKKKLDLPFVAFLKDGKVVYTHQGVLEDYNSNKELTTGEWDTLYSIYEKGFNLIKEEDEK